MSNYIAGIDEAGRGPVIGPLIIAIAICPRSDLKKLSSICSVDSKQLSPKAREEMLKELKRICKFKHVELSAEKLNVEMGHSSLNDIEARHMALLIKGLKSADIFIDLPDRYEWTFRKRMEKLGLKRFEAQHKADEDYPIVGAASIYAKILRDSLVEEIKKETGIDFGSGYPSDEKTRKALKDREILKKLKVYIRERWKTLETVKQRKLFEDE